MGARLSEPVQTGPGAHPVPYKMGTGYRVSFPGVEWPGYGVNHPTPTSDEVKERVELYLYSLSVSGNFHATLYNVCVSARVPSISISGAEWHFDVRASDCSSVERPCQRVVLFVSGREVISQCISKNYNVCSSGMT